MTAASDRRDFLGQVVPFRNALAMGEACSSGATSQAPGYQVSTFGDRQPQPSTTPLSTHNLRRVYQAAMAAAGEDLAHLDLHGPHDLRHTFATWLEDAGIPSRVIDELMGHADGRRVVELVGDAGSRHRRTGRPDRPGTADGRLDWGVELWKWDASTVTSRTAAVARAFPTEVAADRQPTPWGLRE